MSSADTVKGKTKWIRSPSGTGICHLRATPAADADFLSESDRVLGVSLYGSPRAYPISILVWHEIVNDHIGNHRLLLTYCPLCGTGMAFEADVGGRSLDFGVSGLLYNSDMLLYDHQTESLWSQILGQAVSGPLEGTRLTLLPLTHTTWSDWLRRYPKTLVLSRDTGFRRDYGRDPYAGYADNPSIWFSVAHRDSRLDPKELVLGLEIDGAFKAYPFSELDLTPGSVADVLQERTVRILFDAKHRSATATDLAGTEIPSVTAFWFAWVAFHPDTQIFHARDGTDEQAE